jgi:SlyX protein
VLAAMIAPGESMEDRVTTLEIRYTHLEHQVEELNQLLFDQQKMIDRLTREISNLRARAAGVESGTSNDPPPHY